MILNSQRQPDFSLYYLGGVLLKILEQVKDISVDASDEDNFDTGAAIKEDGSLWTWGNNKCGALGNSSEDEYSLKLNNLGLIEPSVRHG